MGKSILFRQNSENKMSAPMEKESVDSVDLFKQSFKYFKRRKPPPDLSDVINFRSMKAAKQVSVNTDARPSLI